MSAPHLIKAGQLAKKAGMQVTTIRFYTKEGLLHSDAKSPGGYNLYDPHKSLIAIRVIQALQGKRFTLSEIKKELVSVVCAVSRT